MVSQTTPVQFGQANLAGDDRALFLKMFSGKVLETFDELNIMEGLIESMTVSSGKSFQFPVFGRAAAKYHARGDNMLDPALGYLNNIEVGEREIFIDRPLTAPALVEDWDRLTNHWDAASKTAVELGRALAAKRDKQLMQVVALAAQASSTLTATQAGEPKAGTSVGVGGAGFAFGTTGEAQASFTAIASAVAKLVEADVPIEDICLVMTPADYFAAVAAPDSPFIHADTTYGQAGNAAIGRIHRSMGFKVLYSNHLPQTDLGSVQEAGTFNTYSGDFSAVKALAFHSSCIGTVRRSGIQVERQRKAEYRADFVSATTVEGSGILRPESAIIITD